MKRARSHHAHLGGRSTGLCLSHGRTRPGGRALLEGQTQGRDSGLAVIRRREEVWNVSEMASFSSR